MPSPGASLVALFVLVSGLALFNNLVLVPAVETATASSPAVTNTTSEGNRTSGVQLGQVGLFGDPEQQLLTVLVILGAAGGVAIVLGIVSGNSGGSAVAGFLVVIAIVLINTLISLAPMFEMIPVVGVAFFTIIVVASMGLLLYTAAGFIAGGSAS